MATKKQQEFWYVMVMTMTGPVFVTGLGDHHTAYWEKEKAPYEVSKSWAKDICVGLSWNGYNAYPVCFPIEIEHQPFYYEAGQFEWVKKEQANTLTQVVDWISEHDHVYADFQEKFPELCEED